MASYNLQGDSELHEFSDDSTEKVIIVPDSNINFNLELPKDALVLSATLNLSLMEHNDNYPINPRLTLGSTATGGAKTLWRFQGNGYGSLGHQTFFNSGSTAQEIEYKEDVDNDDLSIYLPTTAEVHSAKLNLTAIEYDHLSDALLELNREPDGAGDYEPDMIVFKDSLFAVYRSYDSLVTNGSDTDIVINSTSDGENWTGAIELSPNPDSPAPYNDSLISADWWPTLEKFKGRLFCAWESNSTISTNGLDRDIILRSSGDGVTWDSSITQVTDPWESNYSNNPGVKEDWGANFAVFNGNLYLTWTTNNTGSEGGFNYPIGDIMISNSTDGLSWSNATDLTSGDPWYSVDFAPQLAVFNNSLYAVWSSNNTILNNGLDDDNDFDIIYRNTSDGVNWTPPKVLNPDDNDPLTKIGNIDLQPTLMVYDNKLFCAWVSSSGKYTKGNDRDIVIGYTSDGNFSEVSNVFEVSETLDEDRDNAPNLEVFNNRLYIIWDRDMADDSEVFIRNFYFVGTGEVGAFGPVQRVNPPDSGGDDYRPKIKEFQNELYATWVSNDPGTGTGLDRDIILRHLIPSELPLGFGLDLGGEGDWEIPPGTTLTTASSTFDLTTGLKNLLRNSTWAEHNFTVKSYGNKLFQIPLKFNFDGPGMIKAEALEIYYNYTFQVNDFSQRLNDYIALNQHLASENDTIIIPFTLTATSDGKFKVSDVAVLFNRRPNLILNDIPITGKTVSTPVHKITWSDFDPDDDAKISLYYDTDNVGFNGDLIVSNLSEDSAQDYFDWVWWNEIPDGGEVYIYANISDPRSYYLNYSPGPLLIEKININDFIDISIIEPDGISDTAWDYYEIQWNSYCPGEDAKISLFYDNDTQGFDGYAIDINNNGYFDNGDFIPEEPNDGQGSYMWDLTNINSGEDYYIYARIMNHWNISIYNYSSGPITRAHMPAPREFTLIDVIPPTDTNQTPETHKQKPRLTWLRPDTEISENLEYILKVWLGEDNTGEKVYEVTTVATTITILKDLHYGNTYYSEVYAQTQSTTNERQSMVAGLQFKVVNSLPSAPMVTITPKQPKTGTNIVCSIINESVDPDADLINYTYRWFKNGVQQFDFNNQINIPATVTSKGDTWRCVVTPFDGIENGLNGTAQVKILNSAPTITVTSPETGKEYSENKLIFFKFEVLDPDVLDSDNLRYNISSSRLRQPIKTGYVPSTTGTVEFTIKLSEGKHNIKFNISDGESSTEASQEIEVSSAEDVGEDSFVLMGFYIIIIIILLMIIILVFFLAQVRRLRSDVEYEPVGVEIDELEEELLEEELEEEELEEEDLEEKELEEEDLEDEDIEE
jgi:hypothetical protein